MSCVVQSTIFDVSSFECSLPWIISYLVAIKEIILICIEKYKRQSGEPISTIVTLTVGGAIYGIGALTEDKEEQKRLEKIKNLPRTYHDDNVVKGAPVTYDNTIIVSDVVISDSKIADTNTTSSQKE